jgi:hypothetical protein
MNEHYNPNSLESTVYQLIQINKVLNRNIDNLSRKYDRAQRRYEFVSACGAFLVIATIIGAVFVGFWSGL